MSTKIPTSIGARIILMSIWITGAFGLAPVQAEAETTHASLAFGLQQAMICHRSSSRFSECP
jgi:hypothetical protein